MNDGLDRVRWRCRRGLMELEIILECFLDRHYEMLAEAERAAFDELLACSDESLWSLVGVGGNGEMEAFAEEPLKSRLIVLLRQC